MLLLVVLACADPGNSVPTELSEASKAEAPRPAVADPKLPVQLPLRWPHDPMDDLTIDEPVATCVQSWSNEDSSGWNEWRLASDGLPVTVSYDSGGGQRWTRGRDGTGTVRLVYIHDQSVSWRDPSTRIEERYDASGRISERVTSWETLTWTWRDDGMLVGHTRRDAELWSSWVFYWGADGIYGGDVYEGGGYGAPSRNQTRHVWEAGVYLGYDKSESEHSSTFRWTTWNADGWPTFGEGVANEHSRLEAWTVTKAWDDDGRLLSTTWTGERYGDGGTTWLVWDGERVVGTTEDVDGDGIVDQDGPRRWEYDEAGRLVREEGSDTWRAWIWTADGRLAGYEWGSPDRAPTMVTYEGECPAWLWPLDNDAPSGRWEPPQAPEVPGPLLR